MFADPQDGFYLNGDFFLNILKIYLEITNICVLLHQQITKTNLRNYE